MLFCVERVERNTREKERVCIVSFSSCCKLFVLEIKQCVLSPPSVSKPPQVVSPTNNWYQSPVHRKTESFLGYIRTFKVVKNTF
jgi:hypothetical protein